MIFSVVYMFLTMVLSAVADCPVNPPCRCFGSIIDCSSKSLTQVPEFLATNSTYIWIDLSDNNLRNILNGTFSNITVGSSMSLNLRNNNIEFIEDNAFRGFENVSTSIFLDDNNIKSLTRAFLLLNNMHSLSVTSVVTLDSDIMKHIGYTLVIFHFNMVAMNTTAWPPEMSYLTALKILTIYNGRFETFSGDLPPQLVELYVYDSMIMGNLTLLCSGRHLQKLTLRDNYFSGAFISVCQNPLTAIENIAFVSNLGLERFQIGALLVSCPKLLHLDLGNNTISVLENDFGSTNNSLITLHLSQNSLTQVPRALVEMENLRTLYLDKNNISSLQNDDFTNFPSLHTLSLSHNPISFIANTSLKNFTNLVFINFDSAFLTSVPHTIKYLTNLGGIYLSYNNIVSLNYGDFKNLRSLRYIRFSHNPIFFVHENAFDGCPNLQSLQLSFARLTSVPDAIISLAQLERLDLSSNRISSIKDDDFKHKPKLTTLSLNYNPIASISRNAFKECLSLRFMSLRSTLLITVPRAVSNIPVHSSIFLFDAKVRCDCQLSWILKEDVQISGNCFNSTSKISDFVHKNAKSCAGGGIIG